MESQKEKGEREALLFQQALVTRGCLKPIRGVGRKQIAFLAESGSAGGPSAYFVDVSWARNRYAGGPCQIS